MYTIAIIEDDQPTNDQFKGYLLSVWPDCEVQQFFAFDSALAAIETIDFDLVVSDLDLGSGTDRLGGIKIAKVIDSMRCPLLIVSGSPQAEVHRDVFKALGVWDYLQKPVIESDFVTQVKRAIGFRIAQVEIKKPRTADVSGTTLDPNLRIDRSSRHPASWKNVTVHLTMTELRIVEEMVHNLNSPVPFSDFFDLLDSGRNVETLRVHIQNIRSAFKDIDDNFDKVKSKPMFGYFWRE